MHAFSTAHDASQRSFDVAIIGAGPGGYSAALRAAELGLRVALIDRNPHPGGTCVHRGCIPTKALIQATQTLDNIQSAERYGISAHITHIDYGAMHNYIRTMVRETSQGVSGLLAFRGVQYFTGTASVSLQHELSENTASATPAESSSAVPPNASSDNSSDALSDACFTVTIEPPQPTQSQAATSSSPSQQHESTQITARHVILAVGSQAKPLYVQGGPLAWNQSLLNSTGALALTEFPQSAIIIGSGVIATEFASLWNQAGVDVTMIVRGKGLLNSADRRVSTVLTRELQRQGVRIINHRQVVKLETGVNLGVRMELADTATSTAPETAPQATSSQSSETLEAEIALVAIGRAPHTHASWIQDLHITQELPSDTHTTTAPISVDSHYQTRIPGLFAIGDCIAGPQLAHRAFAQGISVAEYIAGIASQPAQEHSIPRIVYASPEVALIGLTKEQASKQPQYYDIHETIYPMTANARTHMLGQTGSITVVSASIHDDIHSEEQPIVIGIHMVGPHVSEFASTAQYIVGHALSVHEASQYIFPHPTFSEALGEALLKADGRPLHMR
ncbi:dihydrolipoamide dehydrogenase [Galliscardovia ingluviei]|uniref:Dihydrolipoamide dehydrogenase n=1 Tax=Galliscardovia ingluviei TaxID=1769422 RepID=A0A8J3AI49_9BIFI|nr:FAD-dependent oxidoreductase [Galliscardovia ingluviei]GGI13808.1 dihydrolipoamide dehydrogenase [Galliscardovia ingluviei]